MQEIVRRNTRQLVYVRSHARLERVVEHVRELHDVRIDGISALSWIPRRVVWRKCVHERLCFDSLQHSVDDVLQPVCQCLRRLRRVFICVFFQVFSLVLEVFAMEDLREHV